MAVDHELVRLIEERIGQDFDGDCHLAEHEARDIAACIRVLVEQNRRASAGADAASFVQSVAAMEIEDIDLEYAVVNLLHGRGALDKKTKTDSVVAIKTLRAILQVARDRAPALGGSDA